MNRDSFFYTMLSRELLMTAMQVINYAARLNANELDATPSAATASPQKDIRYTNALILTKVKLGIVEALKQLNYMLECEQNGKNN